MSCQTGLQFLRGSRMPKTILIAEDSQDDEILCRMVLQKLVANRLVVVRDGKETIDYLAGVGDFGRRGIYPMPDVLMLDLKMPRVDGFGVLEWLKSHPAVKMFVVVLTNFGQTKEVIRAYSMGAHSFL